MTVPMWSDPNKSGGNFDIIFLFLNSLVPKCDDTAVPREWPQTIRREFIYYMYFFLILWVPKCDETAVPRE
jgi:hypothetical protein